MRSMKQAPRLEVTSLSHLFFDSVVPGSPSRPWVRLIYLRPFLKLRTCANAQARSQPGKNTACFGQFLPSPVHQDRCICKNELSLFLHGGEAHSIGFAHVAWHRTSPTHKSPSASPRRRSAVDPKRWPGRDDSSGKTRLATLVPMADHGNRKLNTMAFLP